MSVTDFVSLLQAVRQTSRGWIARCPAHADKTPSLSVREADDHKILVRCWAGCSAEAICAALQLNLRDLFADNDRPAGELARARCERETRRIRETLERERDGLTIDACREAEAFIQSRRGLDPSAWSDEKVNDELIALADAHAILRYEALDG
jgi:DNA primase